MDKRRGPLFLPLLLSAILHAVFFTALSLEYVWPVTVSARKPISVRIIPDALPKPKEVIPPNPESRFLSDANRRESGKGPKKTGKPSLRREEEEKLPARQGAPDVKVPQVAALSPPPAPKPAPPVPKAVRPAPEPPEKKEEAKKPAEAERKKTAPPPEKVKAPEKPAPPPPEKKAEKKKPVQIKTVQKEKAPPEKKPEKKEEIKVASLPPPPKPPAPKAPTRDPLALFRPRPKGSGRPNAPNLSLTDEEAERIAKAARERDLKKEGEEGDVVSLDTRNFKYVSYFAHIKRKIQAAWSWPQEAQNFGGKLTLKFVLRSDGTLSRVELQSSSGYRILDDEAIAAVTKAAPFLPFPPGFGRKILPIEGNFIYERTTRGLGG
ncbi:MAG: TonB family protein [bacterium]|nr:TonB family protein [bacterium]